MIRGSEDAIVAAITAVKDVIARAKEADRDADVEEGEVVEGSGGKRDGGAVGGGGDVPVVPTANKPTPSFPVVPLGASREAEEALLSAQEKKLDKNARRRARKKQSQQDQRRAEPAEWEDGLQGIGLDNTSDVLAALLGTQPQSAPKKQSLPTTTTTTTTATTAQTVPTPAKKLPPPPPGITIPTQQQQRTIVLQTSPLSSEDPIALLAQLRPFGSDATGTNATSGSTSTVPSSGGGYYVSSSGFSIRL